jgi:hypothetical protein
VVVGAEGSEFAAGLSEVAAVETAAALRTSVSELVLLFYSIKNNKSLVPRFVEIIVKIESIAKSLELFVDDAIIEEIGIEILHI